MKCLAAMLVLLSSAGLFAQKGSVEIAKVTSHARRGTISNSADVSHPQLEILLTELERATASTRYDLSGLQVEKWKSGWQTAWLKSSSRKQEAQKLAASLKSNLAAAMPDLIADAQASSGSMSATFKLYNDLSAVVESVDCLQEMAASYGRKSDSSSLHEDYTTLGRIRQDLASYIQLTADSLEPVDKTTRPGTVSYGTVLTASQRVPQRRSGR